MKFILENWLPLLAALGCIAMHLFGHGRRNHQAAAAKAERHDWYGQ